MMSANFLEDDIDVILNQAEFGVTGGVIWQGVAIDNAIFDDESIEAQMGEGVVEIIEQPMITGKTSDFIGIDTDDVINVKGGMFKVKNWKLDGTGVIEIFLARDTT